MQRTTREASASFWGWEAPSKLLVSIELPHYEDYKYVLRINLSIISVNKTATPATSFLQLGGGGLWDKLTHGGSGNSNTWELMKIIHSSLPLVTHLVLVHTLKRFHTIYVKKKWF